MVNRFTVIVLFVGAVSGLGSPGDIQASTSWPTVEPLEKTFRFLNAREAQATVMIRGTDSRDLYKLECHTWRYEGDPDFDYSGDFECRLTSLYSKESYSTLLTDDPKQSGDWQSRGRFLVPELVGKCADYPEYGRVRTFRLRGMRLRFELKDIELRASPDNATRGKLALQAFTLAIAVRPDSDARSAIAEAANVEAPPPNCGPGYRSS